MHWTCAGTDLLYIDWNSSLCSSINSRNIWRVLICNKVASHSQLKNLIRINCICASVFMDSNRKLVSNYDNSSSYVQTNRLRSGKYYTEPYVTQNKLISLNWQILSKLGAISDVISLFSEHHQVLTQMLDLNDPFLLEIHDVLFCLTINLYDNRALCSEVLNIK